MGIFSFAACIDEIKKSELTVASIKRTYADSPEFLPHIGQNFGKNACRTLVIGEVFSTKNEPSDRMKDESFCSYVFRSKENQSCVNTRKILQNYDKRLTADNIAFCYFIHKADMEIGAHRSNFSPSELDDAINTLIPLIDVLKPSKIIFLGSQTKNAINRRSGSSILEGKSFDNFLKDHFIETDIIKLRSSANKAQDDAGFDQDTYKQVGDLIVNYYEAFERIIHEKDNSLHSDKTFSSIKELNETFNKIIKPKECSEKIKTSLDVYFKDAFFNHTDFEKEVKDTIIFVTNRINTIDRCSDLIQKYITYTNEKINSSNTELLSKEISVFVSLQKILSQFKKFLQRALVPVVAIKGSSKGFIDTSSSSMPLKIGFVKSLVQELKPTSQHPTGFVMSLQMVAKRLNDHNPPITTAQGQVYDNKGKGVIVLLRTVYQILRDSSDKNDIAIAEEMLHCFTKRPVAKVFERTDDYVTEDEYWKPFKNTDKLQNK